MVHIILHTINSASTWGLIGTVVCSFLRRVLKLNVLSLRMHEYLKLLNPFCSYRSEKVLSGEAVRRTGNRESSRKPRYSGANSSIPRDCAIFCARALQQYFDYLSSSKPAIQKQPRSGINLSFSCQFISKLSTCFLQFVPSSHCSQVRWRPFFLNPSASIEGVNKRALYEEKFGAARVNQMLPMMTQVQIQLIHRRQPYVLLCFISLRGRVLMFYGQAAYV